MLQSNFDAKKFICGPWLRGAPGGPFNLIFLKAFESALLTQTDNFASLHAHVVTETAVGARLGPNHPGGAGMGALGMQSQMAYVVRNEKAMGLILAHAGYDPDTKDKIEAFMNTSLLGAPSYAAVLLANTAIAAAQATNIANAAAGQPAVAVPAPAAGTPGQYPPDHVAQLWRWIKNVLGQQRASGLLTATQNTAFENSKLSDVGINRDTPERYWAELTRTNQQRTIPKSVVDMAVKFLGQLTFPPLIHQRALSELQNPSVVLAFGPNAGQPDMPAIVRNLQETWTILYDQGAIKPSPSPKITAPANSNRVDGMGVSVIDAGPTDHYGYTWAGDPDDQPASAFIVEAGPDAFFKTERNCWVCRGWGHTKEACPSNPTVKRSIAGAMQGLSRMQTAEQASSRGFRARRIVKRPGRSPAGSPSPSAHESSAITYECVVEYGDGAVYDPEGNMIRAPNDADVQPPSEDAPTIAQSSMATTVTEPSTAPAEPVQSPPVLPSPQGIAGMDANSCSTAEPESSTKAPTMDSVIEQDFQSSFNLPSFNVETKEVCEDADENDEYVRLEPVKKHVATAKAIGLGALAASAGILAACALGVRSARGRAMLTLLMAASGTPLLSPTPRHQQFVQVHSSKFSRSRFSAFDASASLPHDADELGDSQCRQHGTMDTGTTECTSGRRKLFPTSLIEDWHPPIKVEVASGVSLPVHFRGSLVMKVQPMGTTSSKKQLSIAVPHSLYVDSMPVTLISTKALFRYCGVRTYFNDELCMVMPDGTAVGFVETPTNYTVLFCDDDSVVKAVRKPNRGRWPWTPADTGPAVTSLSTSLSVNAGMRLTLKQPLPLTWDLVHDRFAHFAPDRIFASGGYIDGMDIAPLGAPPRDRRPCIHCIRGAFRGHRHGTRPAGKYTRFGQRIYSDSCAMPKSTPFGYIEMYIFYDAATKYIAIYFGKTTQAWEMLLAFKTFIADHVRYMPKGRVEEWYADGGPEFKTSDTEEFCAEMHTRRRFIAPWNPWMNVSETGWRIVLRPLRILLASANVTKGCWPFAINFIVFIHNALSTSSETAAPSDAAATAHALSFIASLSPKAPPPSPYFNVTGKKCYVGDLRTLFCEVEVRIRNKDDLRRQDKPDPVTFTGIYLGPSLRFSGAYVYLFEVSRFTIAAYADIFFREDVRPSLDRIVGYFDLPAGNGLLPSAEQQLSDTGGVNPPELQLPLAPPQAGDIDHEREATDGTRQCGTPGCTFHDGHKGPHSNELVDTRQPRRPDLTLRDQTRRADVSALEGPSSHRSRDVSGVLAAVEGYPNILSAAGMHSAYAVAVAGDGNDSVLICYNTSAPDSLYDAETEPPKTTTEALNGPNADEWRAAYIKDLTAKAKNATFTLVERPTHKKVIKTKVAHAHKFENPDCSTAITERRARWVGLGFLQGIDDFSDTYCATPSACTMRTFLSLCMALALFLAKSDVTKAFTLNPIDVELYVEQMPGMEVAGDFAGATKANTVCLLHKCLEGLKQAGNVWQTTHSAFLHNLTIALTTCKCQLAQSEVDPCLFVGHCSAGIIAILVWVDDLLIAFNNEAIYRAFVVIYSKRFPSKHELGCTRFAGVSIVHQPGDSITVHQRPHIEHAYNKFVVDKSAASKSPFVHRPAVADRNSPLHYSKLGLAANDAERKQMAGSPYLAALATCMYITFFSNPHLSYHTSFLGQFMHDPSPKCWDAILSLIIYMYHNREHDVIVYGGKLVIPSAIPHRRHQDFLDSYGFHSYSDASWLLRSPAALLIMLLNGPIDWGAKLIRVICHSTAEAEIAAGCMLGKRVVFVMQIMSEFKFKVKGPALLLIDNSATEDLSNKFGVTPKTAHFLRWQHYLRWLVTHRWAEIVFVCTKDQLADIMTKVVDMSTFLAACRLIYQMRNKYYRVHSGFTHPSRVLRG